MEVTEEFLIHLLPKAWGLDSSLVPSGLAASWTDGIGWEVSGTCRKGKVQELVTAFDWVAVGRKADLITFLESPLDFTTWAPMSLHLCGEGQDKWNF